MLKRALRVRDKPTCVMVFRVRMWEPFLIQWSGKSQLPARKQVK